MTFHLYLIWHSWAHHGAGGLFHFCSRNIRSAKSAETQWQCNHNLSYLLNRLNLFFKPLSFAEHWSSDTGGRGFAAQLHWARGDDIWESGLGNPVCQTHLHSNPGGRKRTIPLFKPRNPHLADILLELYCCSHVRGIIAVGMHGFYFFTMQLLWVPLQLKWMHF